MSEQSLQEELAELRKHVDWANYRLGVLEQQEAVRVKPTFNEPQSQRAETVAPPAADAPIVVPWSEPTTLPPLQRQPVEYTHTPREPVKLPAIEELLSPARLAWAGGVILVVGLCFLVSYGIRQGWITPEMRIALAAIVSVALGVGGFRMREKGDDGPVPMAMVAVSVAGLFATICAADVRYDMFGSTPVALGFATVVAAAGAWVAVRWNSESLGALALGGALVSPILVEATYDASLFPFVFAAFAATMAICAAKGWRLILLPALLIAAGSAADCLEDAASLTVIVGWSLVWVAAQVGVTGPRVRGTFTEAFSSDGSGVATALSAAALVAAGGYFEIASNNDRLATVWLVGFALLHLALAAATYSKKIKQVRAAEIDLVVGVSLLAIGTALVFDGPALTIAWCLQAAVAAWWIGADEEGSITSMITRASAVGFISLAAIQSISYDAPTSLLSHPASAMSSHTLLTAAVSVLAVAAASAFLAWRDSGAVRYVAMAMSLAAVTYLTAILLDGVPFVLALCAGAAAITWFARDRLTEDGFVGSVALIAMAIAHVLQFEAPVRFALVTGLDDFLAATVSLLAIAGAFAMIAWRGPVGQRNAALGGAALTVMYACSAAIICAFPPGVPIGLNDSIADQLSAGQLGQSLLSAFWALIAFAAIIIGLRRQIKELRIGGLVLLMVAIGKIVFIDLASLDAAYRTISFIAVGGVLLAVAYAFQRLRVDDEPAAEQVPTEAS